MFDYEDIFLEGYYDALCEMEDEYDDYEDAEDCYEDAYLEGYYDALNEASSTAKYLNHHSIVGSFTPGLASFINSQLKQGDGMFSVSKLYPKYVKYCKKKGYTPISKNEFTKEGKKYYKKKTKYDIARVATDITPIGGSVGSAGSAYLRRRSDFVDKAGMKHDIND